MRLLRTASNTLSTLVTVAMLVDCSGNSPMAPTALFYTSRGAIRGSNAVPAPPAILSGSMDAKSIVSSPSPKPTALVFLSDSSHGVVDIFPQAGRHQKMIGQITGIKSPLGLATDMVGNLYVANSDAGNTLVYAPPYTSGPTLILNAERDTPYAVAVSPLGTVAVTDRGRAVLFYARNSTMPCAVIGHFHRHSMPYFAAFEDNGDLYVTANETFSGPGTIGKVSGGCNSKRVRTLSTGNALTGLLGGIEIDKSGRIAVEDDGSGAIYTYNPPKDNSLGDPVSTTQLQDGATGPFAFLKSGRDLYTAGGVTSFEYAYPVGGPPVNSISIGGRGYPFGVAVTPLLPP